MKSDPDFIKRLTASILTLQEKEIALRDKGIVCKSTEKLLIEGTATLLNEIAPIKSVFAIYDECRNEIESTKGVVRHIIVSANEADTMLSFIYYVANEVIKRNGIDPRISPTIFMVMVNRFLEIDNFISPLLKQLICERLDKVESKPQTKKTILPGYG